jgi:hypothetical protein
MMGSNVATAAVLLVLAGCTYAAPAVPLHGGRADLAALHGEWVGTYDGSESGRSGSILLRISAAGDSAHGDVLMIPAGQPEYRVGEPTAIRAGEQPYVPVPLAISFIHAADGRITGRLDAYRDPACGCIVTTTFHGTVVGDLIEGTFSTEHDRTGVLHTGHWRARRR